MSGPPSDPVPGALCPGRALCPRTEGGPRMVYVGIDLHRKRSHVAVVDERGRQLLSRRLVNDPERFRELLGELGEEAQFALEATYGWEWLAELLEGEGRELHLAHPLARRRSPRRGSRPTRSTRARWRSCCAPICCPRPMWRRASCATCATCCASVWC